MTQATPATEVQRREHWTWVRTASQVPGPLSPPLVGEQWHTPLKAQPLLSSGHLSSWNVFCDSSSYSSACFISVPCSDWATWALGWIFFIFLLLEYLTFCLVHSKCLVGDLNFTNTTFLKTLLYYLRLCVACSNNFSSMLSSFSCDKSGNCLEVVPPQMARWVRLVPWTRAYIVEVEFYSLLCHLVSMFKHSTPL